jgi:LuxR family maltose regulon positive regulatory protein
MVITTKIFLPFRTTNNIPRRSLAARLLDAWQNRIPFLLISAPPGYGKSTLLADWIRDNAIPTAWVSLDENDNEFESFLQVLILSIKQHLPCIESILVILNGPQQVHEEILFAEIINHLIQLQEQLLLVLDDYHVIQNSKIHALVQFLLEHQPPQLQITILTRSDPPFNLARMRARRQMVEIRQNELSFSEDESRHLLLDVLHLPLEEDQLKELAHRTEGWAVGLHLAAVSLKEHKDPSTFITQFSGSHRFVIDYLTSEILSTLSGELRAFVCQSAVLNRFSVPLLENVFSIEDGRELLSQVESLNLFMIPLDENREWYRYHHLISTLFQAEIHTDEIQRIKQRAALWFDEQNNPIEAIQLAFDSQSLDLACQFIRKSVIQMAESGRLSTALHWLDRLPPDVLTQNPDLAVIRVWLLIYNGRFQHAFQAMQELETSSKDRTIPLDLPMQGMLLGIKAWSQTIFGHKMDLENLQLAYSMMGKEYAFFSPLMLLALGQAQKESNQVDEARHSFEQGVALTEKAINPVTNLILRNNLAFLLNGIGERQAALQICEEGISRHSDAEGSPGLLAGIPMIAYGCLLYQNGDLPLSEMFLTKSIHLVRRLGLTEILSSPATQILQFLYCDQARFDEALALNQETRQQALKAGMAAAAAFSDLMHAWISYRQGNQAVVLHWIEKHPLNLKDAKEAGKLFEVLLHARSLGDNGEGDQGLQLLNKMEKVTFQANRTMDWIQVKLNQAILLQQVGKPKEAQGAFKTALEKADSMQYHQALLQERKSISPLIHSYPNALPSWMLQMNPTPIPEKKNQQILINPPSEREMEILRLVSAGLSNSEIADRLFITVGTTKWHLNHIYAKLGATRRTDAIVKAREYGLF